MNQKIKILIVLLSVFSVCSAVYKQGKASNLPKYAVDLDKPYEERWRQVVTFHKAAIQNFWKFVESLDAVQMMQLPLYNDKEFMSELKAISKIAQVNFNTTQVVSQMYELLNLIACTSIVARNSDGTIFHARNLDYTFEDFMTPMLAQIDFLQSGKILYSADMIVGTVFVLTGVRNGQYSITINQRNDDGSQTISNLLKQFTPAAYLIHQVLRTKSNYDDAIKVLQEANIPSNCYFIIAGISGNQGAVIEREQSSVKLQTNLSEDNWFICQTNYDRDEEDNPDDYRRIPCEQKLKKLNKKFQAADLFNILSSKPNFVRSTVTSDIMIPKLGQLISVKWWSQTRNLATNDSFNFEVLEQSSSSVLSFALTAIIAIFIF